VTTLSSVFLAALLKSFRHTRHQEYCAPHEPKQEVEYPLLQQEKPAAGLIKGMALPRSLLLTT